MHKITNPTVDAYLQALKDCGLEDSLNARATDEEIHGCETENGVSLPESFIALYRQFNGQSQLLPAGELRWLALHEIFLKRQEWLSICQFYYGKHWQRLTLERFDGGDLVHNTLYCDYWLPFLVDDYDGFYCLDYDPTPAGQTGQIIYIRIAPQLEDCCLIYLAKDFSLWFETHTLARKDRRDVFNFQEQLKYFLCQMQADPYRSLNPPAEPELLQHWEHLLQVEYPANLKKIWQHFNGEAPSEDAPIQWFMVQKLLIEQAKCQEILDRNPNRSFDSFDDFYFAEQEDLAANNYFHPRWLPIARMGDLYVVLDFAPKMNDKTGQVLLLLLDDEDYEFVGYFESFDEWLCYFLYHQNNDDESSLEMTFHNRGAFDSDLCAIDVSSPKKLAILETNENVCLEKKALLPLTTVYHNHGALSPNFRDIEALSPLEMNLCNHYETYLGETLYWLMSTRRAGGIAVFPANNRMRPFHVLATTNVSKKALHPPFEFSQKPELLPYQHIEFLLFLPPDLSLETSLWREKTYWPFGFLDAYAEFMDGGHYWIEENTAINFFFQKINGESLDYMKENGFECFLLLSADRIFQAGFDLFQNPFHKKKTKILVILPLLRAEYESLLQTKTVNVTNIDWAESFNPHREPFF